MSAEILIIDDNADIRLILDELIKDAGYKTRLAANFNQALTCLLYTSPSPRDRG